MSGPVATEDVGPAEPAPDPTGPAPDPTGPAANPAGDPARATPPAPPPPAARPQPAPAIVTPSREAEVGALRVRRALPRRERRTVGAWCFVDHMGPAQVSETETFDVAPHPHMGLQTVTWLLAGEVVHRDSLGSEQVIRPGQLNLMTAGHGVSHSEEHTGAYRGDLHGVQLWVAQPESSRHGAPAFEHHAGLPRVDLGRGSMATVLVGELAHTASPARHDTDHVGADLDLQPGRTPVPLRLDFEYGLVVLTGRVLVNEAEDQVVEPGHLAYLGAGRDEMQLSTGDETRALLLGGTPFPEPVLMWWNFVARTPDEVSAAYHDWIGTPGDTGDAGRFGRVRSRLARIEVGPPPWTRA